MPKALPSRAHAWGDGMNFPVSQYPTLKPPGQCLPLTTHSRKPG